MSVRSAGGQCRKTVIQVKRVFDGCRTGGENITLEVTPSRAIPDGAVFLSARAAASELKNYSYTRGTDGKSTVTGEVVTEFILSFDVGGTVETVEGTLREVRTVLLHLPTEALVPYDIEVQTVMNARRGAVTGGGVSVTGCFLQIFKVTAPVDMVVPSYGYCKYPPCSGERCGGAGGDIFPLDEGEQGQSPTSL